ncbi:MAG: 5-formyltetrahydrofolate cyclo-ligase [Lachnospiraceae bacterium]|nr:5-formyltetrahydrofolate cyclo-ligase [Lachnospiraceae bacterium]
MLTKKEVRQLIQSKKRESDPVMRKEAALSCSELLFGLKQWKNAKIILTYISYNKEMSTDLILSRAFEEGKTVAAPRVEGENMNFYIFSSKDELGKSEMGILEPLKNTLPVDEEALMIMPGVAFDLERNRVGYGGGFYDKYLEMHPKHYKIAIAYEFQILSDFETSEFDLKPDLIVTESRII